MEKNNYEEFEIYRSKDSVNWELILSERRSVDSTIGSFQETNDENLIIDFDNHQLIQEGVSSN